MKKNDEKKGPSMSARVLAGVLAAILAFGTVAGVLMYALLQ